MFHITLPAAVAGALFAAGTAATATVLYTSGPLSGGDSPAPPLAAATLTPSATVTTGPTGMPAPTGTLPPCIPGTPGATPAPCRPPGDQSLPPPPGVPGANFTPGPITVVPLPTPQGLRPYTPGPTAPMFPIHPSTQAANPVNEAVSAMTAVGDESRSMLYYLGVINGNFVPCTRPCYQETDPVEIWKFIKENCLRFPDAGLGVRTPSLWLPEFSRTNSEMGVLCSRVRSAARDFGEAGRDPRWAALARELEQRLTTPVSQLPALSPDELRQIVQQRSGVR